MIDTYNQYNYVEYLAVASHLLSQVHRYRFLYLLPCMHWNPLFRECTSVRLLT
jgi:hypothetical protein